MPLSTALMEARVAAGGGLDHSHWGDPGDRVGGLCCGACLLHSGARPHRTHVGKVVLAAYSEVSCLLSMCPMMLLSVLRLSDGRVAAVGLTPQLYAGDV